VGELASELPVSRPAVSQHLKVLKGARLVSDRPAGNRRIYQVDPAGLSAVRTYLDRFWTQALGAFKEAVERQPTKENQMTTQVAGTSVQTSIVVDAPPARAFEVFTKDIGSWWPPEHHILSAELAEMVFEPRVGGHVIDRGVDGSESRWARVLVYEPPSRVTFTWDITLSWQIASDPDRTSEVEVRFIPEDGERTRVELEHRNLERHGEGWERMRDAVGSPDGWGVGLRRFAERLKG
jgi:uncharacterized protein YndB with AHSA1/START domain